MMTANNVTHNPQCKQNIQRLKREVKRLHKSNPSIPTREIARALKIHAVTARKYRKELGLTRVINVDPSVYKKRINYMKDRINTMKVMSKLLSNEWTKKALSDVLEV